MYLSIAIFIDKYTTMEDTDEGWRSFQFDDPCDDCTHWIGLMK